jgi:hypothetical protein
MAGRNGKRSPPRPQLEIEAPGASPEEAAAIAAALEQFLEETAPPPRDVAPRSRWQRAALRAGVEARQLGGNWGPLSR